MAMVRARRATKKSATKKRATKRRSSSKAIVPKIKDAVYDAGAASVRRTLGWTAPTLSPNDAALANLATLRDRSRQAVRNDGYASGAIDKLVYNIVGTGVKPLPQSDSVAFRSPAAKLWEDWTDHSDADGVLDYYGQQAQVVRCWLEAGECFLRFRSRRPEDDLPVPLQLQVLEPEMCPHEFNGATANGNRIRAGIEFNAIGKRVAYYFYASRPGSLTEWDWSKLRRIPANQILHIFKPSRAGQLRGLPHLLRALIRLRELDKFDDATLLRQQLSAMFVAFLEHPLDPSGSVEPLTGESSPDTEGDRTVLGLKPGIFQELQPGEKVTFSDPPDVPSGYTDFIRQQLAAVSAATGVPYEVLTGDLSKINDRTVRVILHEFRRQIQTEQHQTVAFQMARPVWNAWLDAAFLSDVLPFGDDYLDEPIAYQRVQWMPQGWPYLHPVQDVASANAAIRSGFTSRSAVVAEQGEDAETVDERQAADNARAKELGLNYDSGTGKAPPAPPAFGAPPPAPPSEPDPEPDPDEPEPDPDNPDPPFGDDEEKSE